MRGSGRLGVPAVDPAEAAVLRRVAPAAVGEPLLEHPLGVGRVVVVGLERELPVPAVAEEGGVGERVPLAGAGRVGQVVPDVEPDAVTVDDRPLDPEGHRRVLLHDVDDEALDRGSALEHPEVVLLVAGVVGEHVRPPRPVVLLHPALLVLGPGRFDLVARELTHRLPLVVRERSPTPPRRYRERRGCRGRRGRRAGRDRHQPRQGAVPRARARPSSTSSTTTASVDGPTHGRDRRPAGADAAVPARRRRLVVLPEARARRTRPTGSRPRS